MNIAPSVRFLTRHAGVSVRNRTLADALIGLRLPTNVGHFSDQTQKVTNQGQIVRFYVCSR